MSQLANRETHAHDKTLAARTSGGGSGRTQTAQSSCLCMAGVQLTREGRRVLTSLFRLLTSPATNLARLDIKCAGSRSFTSWTKSPHEIVPFSLTLNIKGGYGRTGSRQPTFKFLQVTVLDMQHCNVQHVHIASITIRGLPSLCTIRRCHCCSCWQ